MIYLLEGNLPLNECYDDEIVQEANSTYQLSFKFPTSDAKWKALKEEVKLVADDLHGEQEFTIFEIVKQHGYVTVYANQVASLLNHFSISQVNVDRVAGNVVMSALAGSIIRQSPFSFYSDIMDKHTLNVSNRSALDVLVKDKHSILGQWGGDLVRDKYQVKLLKNGGVENESLFMYKKNMRSYQQTTSTKELRTRIHFRKKIEVGEGESKKEQWLRVTVDSPLINKYQNIYEADMEVQDEDVKDLASLIDYGKQYFRTTLCDLIEDSLELDVVGTGDVPVKMFDVVTVYHERFDMDMRKKITKYRYSPMGKRLKSVGFGTTQQTLGGALGSMVSDAVKSETAGLTDDFDARLEKELENANRNFDRQKEALTNEITDGIEQAKAKAEEEAQKLRDETNRKFTAFDKSFRESSAENQRQISQALQKVGANEVLANEAKAISSQVLADLNKVRQDAGKLSETVTKNIADFKSQVGSQLGGLATKVEVEQAEGRLTERFAQMKVGGRNYLRNSQFKQGAQFWQEVRDPQFGLQYNYEHSGKADNRNRVGAHFWYHQAHAGVWYGLQQRFAFEGKRGDKVTVSLLVAKDGNASGLKVGLHYRNNDTIVGHEWQEVPSASIDRAYKRVALTFTLSTDTKELNLMLFGEQGKTVNLYVTDVKLETGTIATDWSPAPEDGEADITAAKAEFTRTAEGLSAKLTAVESYVSKDGERSEALRRYSREETARQITAERSAVARDYVAKSSFAETVNGINRRFENVLAPVDGKIASKIAEYKQGVDGQFKTIASQLNGKVNTTDFQRVKETSQLYERIIGATEKDVTDKVARLVMTNQLFQVEVGKYGSDGVNRALGTSADWTDFISRHSRSGSNLNADLHKVLSSGLAVGDNLHVKMEISIDDVTQHNNDSMRAVIQSYGDVTGWNGGRPFEYNLGMLTAGNNWRKVEFDVVMTADMLRNSYWWLNVRVDGARSYKVHTKALKIEKGKRASPWTPAPDDTAQAIKTVQSQLAGSWAVQNLTSAGQVVSHINLLGKNAGIKAETIRLEGQTLADKLTAYEGRFNKLFVADGTFSKLNAGIIGANAITADKIVVNSQLAQKIVADRGVLNTLLAKEVISSYVQAVDLTANQIKSGVLKSLNGSMYFDLNKNQLTMAANDAAIRRIQTGVPTSFLRFDASVRSGQKYVATVLGSGQKEFGQTGYTEDYTKPEFSGLVLENSVNTGRERFATLLANQVEFRTHFGGRGWNFNQFTNRIHPIGYTKETGAQVWATDFVLLDPDPTKNKPHQLSTSLEKLWFIWAHIIWNQFDLKSVALQNLIRDTFNAWKFRN